MAFTIANLLLTEDKRTELTRALANTGLADPLGSCISEATAEVNRFIAGYVVDDASKNSFIRALALFKAYSLVGPVSEDIEKQYDEAIKELRDIAAGKRPNLPRTDDDAEVSSGSGGWGSNKKICT